jgi:hypothetical protein
MSEVANNLKETTKELEEVTRELAATKEALRITKSITQPTEQEQKRTLTQLSKDVENKVAGSEQKYVEYVDTYPTLLKDAKVKVMYEKCKAKIKK